MQVGLDENGGQPCRSLGLAVDGVRMMITIFIKKQIPYNIICLKTIKHYRTL